MNVGRFEIAPQAEAERTPISGADYAAGIDKYLADAERDDILRPHQDVIFHDLQGFFRDGGRKGYVTAPTGTGKTVVFVELSKALLEASETAGRKPKILVVEPTKDLVHQTLGRSGEKGYGEFAPDLKVASFFSDSTEEDKRQVAEADVVVTTYDSLAIMTRRDEMRELSDEEKEDELRQMVDEVINGPIAESQGLGSQLQGLHNRVRGMGQVSTGRNLLDMFDVVMLDEAHHVLGGTSATIVDAIGPEKVVIGFTATPDANEKKRLDTHLPAKIHDLTFQEAISMELLAPLASVGLRTHIKVEGNNLFNKEGDYQEGKLSYLANSTSRNRVITHAAKTLVEHGFAPIIPCIAGQEASHAKLLAEELTAMGVPAAAIHSSLTSNTRKDLYEKFEGGELDVLTNIRILGEGWDSTRAKAIIEAGPTRSPISKRQRIGRIVRPGDIAVVVDIIDDYDQFNPPLHLADILDSETLESGEIFGTATDEQRERVAGLIEALGQDAEIAETIPADYSRVATTLAEYEQIVNGRVSTPMRGHYSVPEKISPTYGGITDEIIQKLWEMKDKKPGVALGRQDYSIRLLYEVGESTQLLREVPVCQQDRAYVADDERWLSAEGFVIGFSQKYPDLSTATMKEILQEFGDTLEWRPLKSAFKGGPSQMKEYDLFKAYHASPDAINALDRQLHDYFEIMNLTATK